MLRERRQSRLKLKHFLLRTLGGSCLAQSKGQGAHHNLRGGVMLISQFSWSELTHSSLTSFPNAFPSLTDHLPLYWPDGWSWNIWSIMFLSRAFVNPVYSAKNTLPNLAYTLISFLLTSMSARPSLIPMNELPASPAPHPSLTFTFLRNTWPAARLSMLISVFT